MEKDNIYDQVKALLLGVADMIYQPLQVGPYRLSSVCLYCMLLFTGSVSGKAKRRAKHLPPRRLNCEFSSIQPFSPVDKDLNLGK